MIKTDNRRIGIIGEKIAQVYLKNKGYEIICTNYYTRNGEIDIVAKHENNLVFVEVKTRTNTNYGTPSEAVTNIKLQHLKRSAAIFLEHNNFCSHIIRFDVIEVLFANGKCKINHIKQVI